MISNNQKLPKSEILKSLQKKRSSKLEVWDLNTSSDLKDLDRELDKLIRRGSVSIIIVEGD